MRFQAILRILGAILGFSSMMSLPALLVAVAFDEWDVADAFLESFLVPAIVGLAMWFPFRKVRYELRLRDGFLIVTGIWLLASAVTAMPFMLAPPYLSFTDAFFESSSGLTTTGATVIVGLDSLPKSVLFFRQSLNFYGGMGIVILAIAILPMLRVGGMQLFRAESTGPVKDAKLTPRIAETAKALWLVYAGLVAACTVGYWLGGMSFFDALSHALATIATGGFSTHDASFAYWDSALIDSIAIVFMTLGGVNFGSAFHCLAARQHRCLPAMTRNSRAISASSAGVSLLIARHTLVFEHLRQLPSGAFDTPPFKPSPT
jgi:trk system potassium uptake protein TrkH